MIYYVSKCPFLYVCRTLQKGLFLMFCNGLKAFCSQQKTHRKGGAWQDTGRLIYKKSRGLFPGLTTVLTTNTAHICTNKAFNISLHVVHSFQTPYNVGVCFYVQFQMNLFCVCGVILFDSPLQCFRCHFFTPLVLSERSWHRFSSFPVTVSSFLHSFLHPKPSNLCIESHRFKKARYMSSVMASISSARSFRVIS